MEIDFNILEKCSIFREISKTDYKHILSCMNAQIKRYRADDYVFLTGDQVDYIGVVLTGSLILMKENLVGTRHIISSLEPSDIFAEGIVCTQKRRSPVTVMTKVESTVLFLPYQKLITTCSNACGFHVQLIHNMLLLLGEKNYLLNHKIDILMLKGLKEKIANFLLYEAKKNGTDYFEIDYNRNELAEYLNVSRPSMSRELANMKDAGMIDYHLNTFHILSYEKLGACLESDD